MARMILKERQFEPVGVDLGEFSARDLETFDRVFKDSDVDGEGDDGSEDSKKSSVPDPVDDNPLEKDNQDSNASGDSSNSGDGNPPEQDDNEPRGLPNIPDKWDSYGEDLDDRDEYEPEPPKPQSDDDMQYGFGGGDDAEDSGSDSGDSGSGDDEDGKDTSDSDTTGSSSTDSRGDSSGDGDMSSSDDGGEDEGDSTDDWDSSDGDSDEWDSSSSPSDRSNDSGDEIPSLRDLGDSEGNTDDEEPLDFDTSSDKGARNRGGSSSGDETSKGADRGDSVGDFDDIEDFGDSDEDDSVDDFDGEGQSDDDSDDGTSGVGQFSDSSGDSSDGKGDTSGDEGSGEDSQSSQSQSSSSEDSGDDSSSSRGGGGYEGTQDLDNLGGIGKDATYNPDGNLDFDYDDDDDFDPMMGDEDEGQSDIEKALDDIDSRETETAKERREYEEALEKENERKRERGSGFDDKRARDEEAAAAKEILSKAIQDKRERDLQNPNHDNSEDEYEGAESEDEILADLGAGSLTTMFNPSNAKDWRTQLDRLFDKATGFDVVTNPNLVNKKIEDAPPGREDFNPVIKNVVILLDYSGSMGAVKFKEVINHIDTMLRARKLTSTYFHLFPWGTTDVGILLNMYTKCKGVMFKKMINAKFREGEWSTYLTPVIPLVMKKVHKPDAIIILTDAEIFDSQRFNDNQMCRTFIKKFKSKIIWALTSDAKLSNVTKFDPSAVSKKRYIKFRKGGRD